MAVQLYMCDLSNSAVDSDNSLSQAAHTDMHKRICKALIQSWWTQNTIVWWTSRRLLPVTAPVNLASTAPYSTTKLDG